MQKFRDFYGGVCMFCKSSNQLQFAHIKPTKCKGLAGGGGHARISDIGSHLDCYRLLCKTCHYNMGGPEGWKDKSILKAIGGIMAGLARITAALKKKAKKHGVKAGQKSLVRPSQKKSVKNGRHQEKEVVKVVAKKKVVVKNVEPVEEIVEDNFLDENITDGAFEDLHDDDFDDYQLDYLESDLPEGD
jgi:hypothetical protein